MLDTWRQLLTEHAVPYTENPDLLPPDPTTLFVTSGMQKHKPQFTDPQWLGQAVGDVQRCLRLQDLDEIDDGRHGLVFHMLGVFSFQHWTVPQGLNLVHRYFDRIGLRLSHVTVHPDRLEEWTPWHIPYGLPVVPDPECRWSDGQMGGYCTEFHVGDIEVGNLVNPLGHSLDLGLGLERISQVLGEAPRTGIEQLRQGVLCLEDSGVHPGPKNQGYVLRRLLRGLRERGDRWDHPWLNDERQRHQKQRDRYDRLRPRVGERSAEWWWDTHGIRVEEL